MASLGPVVARRATAARPDPQQEAPPEHPARWSCLMMYDMLHTEQLRMFMRPAEIKQAVTRSPDNEGIGRRGLNAMWKYKEAESEQEGWIGYGELGPVLGPAAAAGPGPGVAARHAGHLDAPCSDNG